MSRHVVIAGTGRTGTTFLVKLFTHLGLDTGFRVEDLSVHNCARAGLEINLLKSVSPPYLVKDPLFYQYVGQVLASGKCSLDCVILPVRNLSAASYSREHVEKQIGVSKYLEGHIPGGFYDAKDRAQQEDVLLRGFYKLLFELSKSNVPLILLHYPSLAFSCEYLYEKLSLLIPNITFLEFKSVYEAVCEPGLVNTFNDDDCVDIHKDETKLGVPVDVSQDYSAQIFIDTGNGFSELESYRYNFKTLDNLIEHTFDIDLYVSNFRFDPLDSICSVHVEYVKYLDIEEGWRFADAAYDNSCFKGDDYYFNSNDPQITYEINSRIKCIVVKYRYASFGVDTLSEVINKIVI